MKKKFEIDGVVREFDVPDDATDDEILEFVNSEVPPTASEPQKHPGYLQRVGAEMSKEFSQNARDYSSSISATLQDAAGQRSANQKRFGSFVGGIANVVPTLEAVGQGVGSTIGAIGHAAFAPAMAYMKAIPQPEGEAIKRESYPVSSIAPLYARQSASTLGDIAKAGSNIYANLSPRSQRNVASAFNIGTISPVGAAGKAAANVTKETANVAEKVIPKAAKMVKNERGGAVLTFRRIDDIKADEIADIEKIEAGIEPAPIELEAMGPATNQTATVTGKELKQSVKSKPKKPFLSGIKDEDAFTLNTPEDGEVIPFDKLAKTQADMMNPKNKGTKPMPSAMDEAGSLGVKAWKKIKDLRQQVGKKYDAELQKAQQEAFESGVLFQGQPVREKWAEIVRKYFNGEIDENGKITAAFGEGDNVTKADIRKLEEITRSINQVGDAVFPKEYVSLSQKVMALVKQKNANLPINSRVEGAGKEFSGFVDDYTEEYLGPEFREASQKYRKLRTLETALSKRLGDVVDPDKEIARHGASLLKSAIMSNADRGGKVMFNEIKKLTGIDLYRTANYAKIAMEATGDHRILDLLKETGTISGMVAGNPVASAAANLGMKKVKQKFDENLLANMVNYYNKSQGRTPKNQNANKLTSGATLGQIGKGGK